MGYGECQIVETVWYFRGGVYLASSFLQVDGQRGVSCPFRVSLTLRNDSQEIRCQSGLEIKCCSSILYIMLVVDCEDSFKQEVGVFHPMPC